MKMCYTFFWESELFKALIEDALANLDEHSLLKSKQADEYRKLAKVLKIELEDHYQ